MALDTQSDQVVLSVEAAHEGLKLAGYNEYPSEANPFEAEIDSGRQTLNSLKYDRSGLINFMALGLYRLDCFISGRIDVDGIDTSIAGIGLVSTSPPDSTMWAEYGARLGFKFVEHTSINTFVDGVFSESELGQSVHGGISIRSEF